MGNGKLFRNKNGLEMATVQKFEVSEMRMVQKWEWFVKNTIRN